MRRRYYLLCIVIPLGIGTILYLYWRPDAYVTQWLFGILGRTPGVVSGDVPGMERILRFYLCDVLWAYALGTAFSWLYREEGAVRGVGPGIALMVILELLQLIPGLPGSFDTMDIVAELAAFTLAVAAAENYEYRRNRHEKVS